VDGFCAGTLEGIIFMSQARTFSRSSAAAEDTRVARCARCARCARLFRCGGIKVQSGELARKPKNKLVFNKWKGFVPEHWMGNICR